MSTMSGGREPVADRAGLPPMRRLGLMTENERVAVRLLRRVLPAQVQPSPGEQRDGVSVGQRQAGAAEDALEPAILRIRRAIGRLEAEPPAPLQIAGPEDPDLTGDERCLLRALAAAQHADEAVLDDYLAHLAPTRGARARLAHVVRALADVLVVSGRLLRSPSLLCWSLPAAALTVARLHGYEPGISAIAWPPRS